MGGGIKGGILEERRPRSEGSRGSARWGQCRGSAHGHILGPGEGKGKIGTGDKGSQRRRNQAAGSSPLSGLRPGVGLATSTKPGSGQAAAAEGRGAPILRETEPRGRSWGLGCGHRQLQGHGVRQIRVERHKESVQPEKESLLLSGGHRDSDQKSPGSQCRWKPQGRVIVTF